MPGTKVILLMGATATGKTDLALEIGRHFPVEIISVDSALIYRGMDIGTAKPEPQVLDTVPHHLIDIIDPAEPYSVWDFVQQSRQLANEISARGRIPLLVGGTMMYFHAFERGLNRLPEADVTIRQRLNHEAQQNGWQAMHDRLVEVDPVSANRIRPTDTQRIQRALEVYELAGESLSELQQNASVGFDGKIEKIILAANDRAKLHKRIEARFLEMLELGFVEEVTHLKARDDLNLSLPSMRCVGYRQIWQYLDGDITHPQMIEKGVAATRQLAKRQITWLRKQDDEKAFDCLNYRKDAIFRLVEAAFSGL
ncbi:MAG: tRNA (adenosine(37)-N6)-dimethylallyltransferase MiaA [Gammaproteobacteria bacterium]|nr:tRNA (adenosine(37)-N6)-dimethylallyltransferase MiaA [Gammaproteobacteria bacterium]